MNNGCKEQKRRWPWNVNNDDENFIEPYDETEDVRKKSNDFDEW